MKMHRRVRSGVLGLTMATLLAAQAPPILVLPPEPQKPAPAPPPQAPAAPAPAAAAGQARPPAAAPSTEAATALPEGEFRLDNVSLRQMIDILARALKINYIIDPRVNGSVTVKTYGEVRPSDKMQLLQTILRINGATLVQVGNLYRIVPSDLSSSLPISPLINGKNIPDDDRPVLNLVFLKYATVDEMAKLLQPFLGEGGKVTAYAPGNLLLILDNARNMRRTMELVATFDSDTFAGQRVRLLNVSNGRPSDIAKELETVFKAYALSEKSSAVRFVPVDRIGTIIAVAPNPGIFTQVDNWLKKLDVKVKVTAGALDNYVYRLKYGRAETVAMAIMALYMGNPFAMMGMGMMGGMGMGYGGMGMGGMGYGGMGGMGYGGMGMGGMGYGGMGMGGMGYGGMGYGGMGMGGMGYGGMGYGGMGYGGMGYGGMGYGGMYGGMPGMYGPTGAYSPAPGAAPAAGATAQAGSTTGGTDLTGSYLGSSYQQPAQRQRIPVVIPNPFDNTLLVQGTAQEWDQISRLLEQLDVPPRQVLIEAKIYEVSLTGAFASGIAAYLKQVGDSTLTSGSGATATTTNLSRTLLGNAGGQGINLTAGLLVGQTRQLLGILHAEESAGRGRIISEPSIIATDSIPAIINVGQDVPTLASQAVSGATVGGSSLFANTVNTRNSGVTLNVMARVNSSGVVTLIINQEVSQPVPPPASSAIQSPSFTTRNIQTQLTVQDGDTVALGGIIQQSDTLSSAGVPLLHRIPVLGGAFGNKTVTKDRTELVIFITPRVIYDTNQLVDATEELTSGVKKLRQIMKER